MAANHNKTKAFISYYINYNTDVKVSQKGIRLFNGKKVTFKSNDPQKDIWKFNVQGGSLYDVTIIGISKEELSASCSCPYDRGGICKHTVASLLYIKEHIGNGQLKKSSPLSSNANKPKLPSKRTGEAKKFEIPNYRSINRTFVENNVSFHTLNSLGYSYSSDKVKKVSVSKNLITFEVNISWRAETVKLEYEDEKVYISTTEEVRKNFLSKSEALSLLVIADIEPNLLDILFNKKSEKDDKKLLENFGLDKNANFNDYFEYGFDLEEGMVINRKRKTKGLIPITDDFDLPILNFLAKTSQKDKVLSKLDKPKEKRKLAFVLEPQKYYTGYYFNDDDSLPPDNRIKLNYKITSIIGKPNKAGTQLTSHFETYQNNHAFDFQIEKSEKTDEILKIIDDIDNCDEREQKFQLYKSAFNLLVDEPLIYGFKNTKGEIRKNNLEVIKLSKEPLDIYFEAKQGKEFVELELKLKLNNGPIKKNSLNNSLSDEKIALVDNTYHFIKNLEVSDYILNYPGSLKMAKAYKEDFFNKVIEPVSKNFEIEFKKGSYKVDSFELDFSTKQVFLSENNEYLVITPQVEYQNGISTLLSSPGHILVKENGCITEYKRNFELEEDFIELLASLHPFFLGQKGKRIFYLHISEFMKNMWFYKFFDHLQANNVEVYGLKDLKSFNYSPYKGKVSTSVSSGEDWFDVNIELSFGDNIVSLKDIKKAIINKQKYIQLNDGSVGILPSEWLLKLEKYFRNGEIKNGKLSISKLRFSIIDQLFDDIDDTEILKEIAKKRKRLASFSEISKTKVPATVNAELRHYQKEGLNWLNFLHEMQWGGILADDMGLGKTLQILTFLLHINVKKKSTSLIVVPTTLLFNWENEIAKFTPKLKALYHYGTNRDEDTKNFSKHHIIFTTYGILLRDVEMLKGFEFNYVILDESQAIKNPASRRYKAANLLNAKNRIALSGTPIENSTFDLFAQMSFVNRGFWEGAKAFKDNYSTPIDKDGDELVAIELQKLINPFVLRRTKEKVADELPSKTEDIIFCEMEPTQRKVYDAYRNNYRDQLIGKIEEDGLGKSKMLVLEALTRLRQICDSPSLLKSDDIVETQSIKIKEIIRHITLKTANHKILIFSQFVEMLSLVKEELSKLNIAFEYLDGQSSTKKREQSVNNFQENADLRVFLISLKAGGTGLNLTAADYVYLLDPWWNPAVENQAIDRCYRIGQDKKVFAYRMICKNTIEEKILNLQNKKKKIAGDIIQTDENIMKKIDVDDIKDLFS